MALQRKFEIMKKGVLLCGGFGTRLRPLTLVLNKHLLPVYSKPMCCYPIETLKSIGVTNVCIVLGGENVADFIKFLGNGLQFGMRFTYVCQQEAGGIAEAVGLCEDFINGEDFMVILGDNLFLGDLKGFEEGFESSGAVCGLLFAQVEKPQSYGVPRFEANGKLAEIIEKPRDPPSPYAVTGLYAYKAEIFDVIRKSKPSGRGELEISDAHTEILKAGKKVYSEIFRGIWLDCGESYDSLLEAAIEVSRWEKR